MSDNCCCPIPADGIISRILYGISLTPKGSIRKRIINIIITRKKIELNRYMFLQIIQLLQLRQRSGSTLYRGMATLDELDDFLSVVEDCLIHIQERVHSLYPDVDELLHQVERILRFVVIAEELLPQPHGESLCAALCDMLRGVQHLYDTSRRRPGRPPIDLPEEELRLLLQHRFRVVDIARLLNVSSRTVRRRIILYGLEEDAGYTCIPDEQLDEITADYVHRNPYNGLQCYRGFLRSIGVHIQRWRARESMVRTDSRGMQTRFRRVLQRRQYNVCMPNSLWHIDGYHKLIMWRIVIHGGVDGYSRLPVYLNASNNNRADTVLHCFEEAVQRHGIPSRVRCDKGGENVLVSQYMLNHPLRGPGRGSCITGRSVHNQRIERFWRDLYPSCIAVYYTLFCLLEDLELLDRDSNVDMFCLHYIFLPRVNHSLDSFRASYSHHPVRTEHNRTPYQLWISGMVQNTGDDAVVQGIEDASVLVSWPLDLVLVTMHTYS